MKNKKKVMQNVSPFFYSKKFNNIRYLNYELKMTDFLKLNYLKHTSTSYGPNGVVKGMPITG